MLPSTGYFKGILCPFNENGLCERPYCHYRHLDFDESGTILQKLVSAAVLKALQKNDTSGAKSSAQHSQGDSAANPTTPTITLTASKATYNPTPIAELNKINSTDTENLEEPNEQRKRHIPVPYTPRKSSGLPIKRSVDINDPKPFIYNPPGPPVKYKPGSSESIPIDTYTPTGTVESKEKYLPGVEKELPEYTPDTNAQVSPSKLNYVPSSDKNINKNKLLEYKPAKVAAKTEKPIVTYRPTPRALAPCFSSDEEEPQTKKRKVSSDLNGLDDLGPEFDILDQILDEEKQNEKDKNSDKLLVKSKHSSKDIKKSNGDIDKSEKDNKTHHKSKSDENHKSKSDENHKSKSVKKSSEESRKSKSDTKSSNENHHKKGSDENYRSKSDKKADEKHKSKSEKKSFDENHKRKSEKKSDENHKSKSIKKSSDENHRSKSVKKEKTDEKGSKEHRKSSYKSKDVEKEKKDSKDKHSNDDKKHSSRSSDHSPKHSKRSSSKKSDKHSESRSSSSSKSKEKNSKEKRHKKSKDKDRHRSEHKVLDSSDPEILNMDELDAEDYDLSDADEDAIALECKRIFEEYVPTEKAKSPDENNIIDNLEEEYIPSKKRISRTTDKNIKVIPRTPVKPDFKVSAANTMAERLSKVREFHSSRNIQSTTNPSVNNEIKDAKMELHKATFSVPNPVPSKVRIAHVPYASTMLNTKKTMSPGHPPEKLQPSSATTISQTVKKGVQRVAHMPSEKFIDRPGVLEPLASKIPANIRSIYLNMMIDECLKLYLSTHDAYARAQHEELNTSKKCSTVPIYKNSAVLAVSRLRKELVECNGVKKSANDCSSLKPDSSLKAMNSGSWSIENKNYKKYEDSHEFTGAKFYENIKKWVLTEEQLKENSYPRPHESGQKGRAIIYGQNRQTPPKGYLRTCCRCKKEYTVNKRGFPIVQEECIYHPNRKYRVRGEARYQCCTQDGTSDGCCVAPSHVYEYVDFEHLKGYVTTLPADPQAEVYGVYSLDCEMCYTTNGLDLTRVTVINSACKVVYETLVRPLHPIIDYNTRYSGITEEQMCHVKTTLLDVQATLLTMFSSKTILVGHSLESDFKALKLIHDTVIDTSVLFPHKMGPPFKRALRNLSTDYLRKIIQNSVEGHDSAEDAMVCMELLQYKLKEDLKTR